MVIAEVNRVKINSPADFEKAIADGGKDSTPSVLLLVRSDQRIAVCRLEEELNGVLSRSLPEAWIVLP